MPKLHFVGDDGTRREVEARNGETVMLAARAADVPGIIGECGGSMNCLTCHCYVAPADVARVGPPSKAERELLDELIEARKDSRLSCQIVVSADLDGVTFRVPQWQG